MNNLKEEWLKRVTKENRKNIFDTKKSSMSFTVNTELHLIPEELQDDYDINLQAAIIGKEYLWNLSKELRHNKDFILDLIKNNYSRDIYAYIDSELKKDVDIFKECLKRKDDFKWGISYVLSGNRDLMVEAMKIHDIYPQIKEHYQLDKEIVGIHLENNPGDFTTLKKSMKNYFSHPKRKDFLINLLKKSKSNLQLIYCELSDTLKENLEVIDVLLTSSPYNFSYLPSTLREDKAFTIYAIDKYDVTDVHNNLKEDREIVEKIIEKHGNKIYDFKRFKNDVDIVRLAINSYPKIDIIPNDLLPNRDLILALLNKDASNASKLLERFTVYSDDYEVMKICVEHDGSLLKYSTELKNNKELSEIALASTGDFDLVSIGHLKSKSIVLQLLNNKDNCKKAVKNKEFLMLYKNDKEIAKKIIEVEPNNLSYFPELKADKNFIEVAINNGLKEIKVIDPFVYFDKEIAIKFAQLNVSNYGLLPLQLKNDHDVALATIQVPFQYKLVIENSTLGENKEFTLQAIEKHPEIYTYLSPVLDLKNDTDIMIKYIESSIAQEKELKFPQEVYDSFGTKDPLEIKSTIMRNELEKSLNKKDNIVKKMKI
jgi:hypothetical protein